MEFEIDPKHMDKCAVYLMQDRYSGDVKIGISNNPELRRTQVQSSYNVGGVSLVAQTWFFTRDEARKYEKAFHYRYSRYLSPARGGREWFKLSQQQIDGFLAWMKASTQSRVYNVRRLSTKIWKSDEEVQRHRWSAFFGGLAASFLTGCIPVATMVLTNNPAAAIGAPVGVGAVCALRVKKDKEIYIEYGIDGKPLPEDFPHTELIQMKLWKATRIEVPDYSMTSSEEFPKVISALEES
tara:strand:+ start:92 stop:808 length:717 start_codon:yes stop_codon:yes gene_type:complete